MEMVGGATSGYWAIGSLTSATTPTITMTIDKTMAKMGRSIKKRDMGDPLQAKSRPGKKCVMASDNHLPSSCGPARHLPFRWIHGDSRAGAGGALHNQPFVTL